MAADVFRHNQDAWNREARAGERWSTPVSEAALNGARAGRPEIFLTPNRPVPAPWLDSLAGSRVLALASGGGQQAPLLAAAGAEVWSLDASLEQLRLDQATAARAGYRVRCLVGDMADLGAFPSDLFDWVINPVSTVFVPEVRPVWREVARVLKPGGRFLTGVMNPAFFLFDHDPLAPEQRPEVRYALPTNDLLEGADVSARAIEFSHSLTDLIAGQLEVGLALEGFFEDDWDDDASPLNRYFPIYLAMHSRKRG